jgi:hypothetical protein
VKAFNRERVRETYRDLSLEAIRRRERAHHIKYRAEERDDRKRAGGEGEIKWESMRERGIGRD